jgi:hypothetical protein
MTSIPCDIVILPSDELAQKLIATSRELRTQNALFTLDGIEFYPRIPVYDTAQNRGYGQGERTASQYRELYSR